MNKLVRVACVQTGVVFGDIEANLERLTEKVRSLSGDGIDLFVFPEAYLTGYCVASTEEASAIAVQPGHQTESVLSRLQGLAEEVDGIIIVGYASQSESGKIFNVATLFEPGTEPRPYQKTHLPELGLDRFVEQGSQLQVLNTRIGTIGVLICFDIRSPEATRTLALQGADVLVLPTNWPFGADIAADLYPLVRASENKIFYATCNRVGEENGFKFIGKSKIVSPFGKIITEAANADEAVLIADLDFEIARDKRVVTVPGKHETTVFASRRPELYSEIIKPSAESGV